MIFVYPPWYPFLVSFAALERLWEAFNDVADGFGVSQYEMEVRYVIAAAPSKLFTYMCYPNNVLGNML
jgi:hypothetical protein